MAKLSDEHKTFIVIGFACFKTGTMIVDELKTEYSVTADLQQVLYYSPEKTTGGKDKLGKRWKTLFEKARSTYIGDVSAIGIAHQRYRMEIQQKLLNKELERGAANKGLILDILERGAKETGGAYTNRRELTGKNGGPVETVGLTVEQWKIEADKRRKQAEAAMAPFEE
jgi:hypothetical protein